MATALVIAPTAAFATHSFDDVDDSDLYHAAVDWMKDNGVTVGCNPPDNTRYCPGDPVTRGEMAPRTWPTPSPTGPSTCT